MDDDVRPWQVRRVWFAYADDHAQGKYRRVIVKEVLPDDCVVIYVTSKIEKRYYSDFVLLEDWADEGFSCASAARIHKTIKVPISALGECLGRLSPRDRLEIQMKYRLRK